MPGTRALRALQSDNASGFTRSAAERMLRGLIRAANLPRPRFNARLAGYEVDAVWPDRRLVVEVDGYAYHGHRAQFERDRRKDLALTAAGYRVIRVSWRQLTPSRWRSSPSSRRRSSRGRASRLASDAVRVLLTNDDGIEADGLQALRRALLAMPGIELAVIAPDGNRSAMARSITTRRPLWVRRSTSATARSATPPTARRWTACGWPSWG